MSKAGKKPGKAVRGKARGGSGGAPGGRSARTVVLFAVLVVVVLVGAVAIARSISGSGSGSGDVVADDDPFKGEKGARVIVREFSDFQCPSCKAAAPALDRILSELAGKVQVRYENFPLPGHKWAMDAAVAGECAFEQDKFWPFHDEVFRRQEEWSEAADARSIFRDIARTAGLDLSLYDSCLAGPKARARVNNDLAEGRRLDVGATPTFFVNGVRFVGRSFQDFETLVRRKVEESPR